MEIIWIWIWGRNIVFAMDVYLSVCLSSLSCKIMSIPYLLNPLKYFHETTQCAKPMNQLRQLNIKVKAQGQRFKLCISCPLRILETPQWILKNLWSNVHFNCLKAAVELWAFTVHVIVLFLLVLEMWESHKSFIVSIHVSLQVTGMKDNDSTSSK